MDLSKISIKSKSVVKDHSLTIKRVFRRAIRIGATQTLERTFRVHVAFGQAACPGKS